MAYNWGGRTRRSPTRADGGRRRLVEREQRRRRLERPRRLRPAGHLQAARSSSPRTAGAATSTGAGSRRPGGGWPSGFVHFDDEATWPWSRARRSAARPRSGKTLDRLHRQLDAGGDVPFQWYADGKRASPAPPPSTFTPTADYLRKQLSVRVRRPTQGLRRRLAKSHRDGQGREGHDDRRRRPDDQRHAAGRRGAQVDAGTWSPAPGVDHDPLVRRRQGRSAARRSGDCTSARSRSGKRITVHDGPARGLHDSAVTSQRPCPWPRDTSTSPGVHARAAAPGWAARSRSPRAPSTPPTPT